MGKKKKPQNIRDQMRGLKNRWGRFQCPRDGSICRSLEAWHWHRIKYHPTEKLNFVELGDGAGGEEEAKSSGKSRKSPPFQSPSSLSSVYTIPHLTLPPLPSSERLLPPEAFATRRQETVIPDDISDLTEPEIPILLTEEVPPVDELLKCSSEMEVIVRKEMEETRKICEHEFKHDSSNHRVIANEGTQRALRQSEQLMSHPFPTGAIETREQSHSSESHRKQQQHSGHANRSAVASSNEDLMCPNLPMFKMISMFITEQFEGDKKLTVERVLPQVEDQFSALGLSRETLVGIAVGTLIGAAEQWKHGYDAGWRDGVKEVLHAPILSSFSFQRHPQDDDLSPDYVERENSRVFRHSTSGQSERRNSNLGQERVDDVYCAEQTTHEYRAGNNREGVSSFDRGQSLSTDSNRPSCRNANDFNNNNNNNNNINNNS